MSFDYYLVVPAEKWPSFDQLQSALDKDGLAVEVVRPDGVLGAAPFSMDSDEDGFDFVRDETKVHLGGWLSRFSESDFKLLEDTFEEEYSHEVVQTFKQLGIPIRQGDILAHMSFWDSDIAFGVWNFVCASFVKHFDSNYYDPQSGEVIDESGLIAIGNGFCSVAEPSQDQTKPSLASEQVLLSDSDPKPPLSLFQRILTFLGLK